MAIENRIVEPCYSFVLDGRALAGALAASRSGINATITRFRAVAPTPEALRAFLLDCKDTFDTFDAILCRPQLSKALGLKETQLLAMPDSRELFGLPLGDLFETRINMAVLGEAGAGKTTSLQSYASRRHRTEPEAVTLFAPMARAIGAITYSDRMMKTLGPRERLQTALLAFLDSNGAVTSSEQFEEVLQDGRTTIILDGVDEAMRTAPWIGVAVRELAAEYPRLQLIVSCRHILSFIAQIPFLQITLLPFTCEQRSQFISDWFGDPSSPLVVALEHHVDAHRSLGELVRNPLLATILCVVASHGVPLPATEIELYEARFRLLFGDYDLQKGARRLRASRQELELVSRKLAYHLHGQGRRDTPVAELIEAAQYLCHRRIDSSRVETVVDDLMEACGVLVPMTETGNYGFGHLRLQEYLAAVELSRNRGVEIAPLTRHDWWKGVLRLFAAITDDIESVLEAIIVADHVYYSKDGLREMVAARPHEERLYLEELLNRHLRLDQHDLLFEEQD